MQADRVVTLPGWFPHVFWFLNAVIKLRQLPITEFKVALHFTAVSASFLLSLAFYYHIFLEMRGRDIISLSTQNLKTEGVGQDTDSLAFQGNYLDLVLHKGLLNTQKKPP